MPASFTSKVHESQNVAVGNPCRFIPIEIRSNSENALSEPLSEEEPIIEAAHIRPYFGAETNVVQNGLLLRADIHTLFDLGLISVSKDRRLLISTRLNGTEYEAMVGKKLRLPALKSDWPSEPALEWHRDEHGWSDE